LFFSPALLIKRGVHSLQGKSLAKVAEKSAFALRFIWGYGAAVSPGQVGEAQATRPPAGIPREGVSPGRPRRHLRSYESIPPRGATSGQRPSWRAHPRRPPDEFRRAPALVSCNRKSTWGCSGPCSRRSSSESSRPRDKVESEPGSGLSVDAGGLEAAIPAEQRADLITFQITPQ